MRHASYILLLALQVSTPTIAQRDDVNKLAVLLARDQTSMTVGRVRYDLVGVEQPDVEDLGTLYLRVARKADQVWKVTVYNSTGEKVMSGTYLDENLTIADGRFVFYHRNGQVESSGRFDNGRKVDTWERYSERGDRLSDRHYSDTGTENGASRVCGWTISCRP